MIDATSYCNYYLIPSFNVEIHIFCRQKPLQTQLFNSFSYIYSKKMSLSRQSGSGQCPLLRFVYHSEMYRKH